MPPRVIYICNLHDLEVAGHTARASAHRAVLISTQSAAHGRSREACHAPGLRLDAKRVPPERRLDVMNF